MVVFWKVVFFTIVCLIEWYFFQAVQTVTKDYSEAKRSIARYIYFGIAAYVLIGILISLFVSPVLWSRTMRNYFGSTVLIIFVCQVIGLIPLIFDDIIRLFAWIFTQLFSSPQVKEEASRISRLRFLSWASIILAAIPGFGLLYGLFRGGHSYKVHKSKLNFPHLPEAFHGFKIVQVSDIHTGSFIDDTYLRKAFQLALDQKPDIIFFTGDLVNNLAEETLGFMDAYRMLKAPHGVYSVLGNHDYGDYVQFESEEAKQKNLANLKKVHAAVGWKLLLNEHTLIEKNGQSFALLGIENCPHRGSFIRHRYGKMEETYKGSESAPFKILLSHDPSHWDKQVSVEEKYRDIDLTLSGHTHGMQFGIEIPGLKWSPVKYVYPQWAGLYQENNQYLYVNRGLGYIGYNGRLGIWPEITVIELFKS